MFVASWAIATVSAAASGGAEFGSGDPTDSTAASEAVDAETWWGAGTRIRCWEPKAMRDVRVVIGVKTTRFYHASRAVAVWETWGHRIGYGLMFASDGPIEEAIDWTASVVVVEDEIDLNRSAPHVPPWRDPTVDVDAIDPFALPQLTRRVAALLTAMHDCWGSVAEWFVVADDDTLIRPTQMMRALHYVGSDVPQMYGVPVSSDTFTLQEHQQEFGPSVHCGGSSVVMSHTLAAQVVHRIDDCLGGEPRTTLAWYWDEVELLGRCVYEFFRVNCTELPTLPFSYEQMVLPVMLGLANGVSNDLVSLVNTELRGKWKRLPIGFFHPVDMTTMYEWGRHFGLVAVPPLTQAA